MVTPGQGEQVPIYRPIGDNANDPNAPVLTSEEMGRLGKGLTGAIDRADAGQNIFIDLTRELTPEELEAIEAQRKFFEFATASGEEQAMRAREMFELFTSAKPHIQQTIKESFAPIGLMQQQAAERAGSEVRQAYAAIPEQQERQLSRLGISPTSARSQALQRDVALARAAAEAGAKTQARAGVRQQQRQRQLEGVALGMQAPGPALQAAALGTQAYGAGAGGLASTLGQSAGLTAQAQQNALQRAFAGQENALNRQQQMELARMNESMQLRQAGAQNRAAMIGGIGNIAGLFTGLGGQSSSRTSLSPLDWY